MSETTTVDERMHDRHVWRHAFNIIVTPSRDEPRFHVRLFQGATEADKEWAQQIIRDAQAGRFDLSVWEQRPPSEGHPFTRYIFSKWVKSNDRPTATLRPCHEPGCIEDFHGWVDGQKDDPCWTEPIHHGSGVYMVRGYRYSGEEWQAHASHDSDAFPSGSSGLRIVRDLANDLAWVQGECDRLNAVRREAA
ncbi:hypothetical protein ACWGOE_01720 [Leucobacter chromiiresistens]